MSYQKLKTESYRAIGGMNSKASQYITAETEYLNLQNVDFRTIGALSSFAGSETYTLAGSTSEITGIGDFYKLGTGFGITTALFATDRYNVSDVTGLTYSSLYRYVNPNNPTATSFANLNNYFGANGQDFWTYQIANFTNVVWQYSLGKPILARQTINPIGSGGGLNGILVMYYSIARQDGFLGPVRAITYPLLGYDSIVISYPSSPNLNVNGFPGLSLGSFGVSGIQAWAQLNQLPPLGLNFLLAATNGIAHNISLAVNFTAVGWSRTDIQPQDFQGTFLYGAGSTQGSENGLYSGSNQPTIIEPFFNQLFMAIGSRIYFSDPGTPEQSEYTNFFDVALDDRNNVSLLKTYFTQLVIGKPERIYALSGTGPSTFVLSLVSSEYGCLSFRASTVWNQYFWFLDKKGIMQFDGANVTPTSNKMEDIFNRMNVPAAQSQAVMAHMKDRNEVWTAIPIDGSLTNNIIVVYDYLSNAWTTRTCPPGAVTAMTTVTQGPNKQTIFYGTSSGMLGTFGSSLMGDNGIGLTSVIKSRFIAPLGDSTTNLFRRLYIDASVPIGQTFDIQCNFYQDHGTTYSYSTTMTLTSFQNRIDFGIAAKSLAVEFLYNGTTFLQFNGFTIESRFQRST